ncbi:MAG: helix-turn-helix domain-containing protein [Sarcina sp.]
MDITKLKDYRLRNNISQVELASLLGISKGMLSKIESKKKAISSNILSKLIEVTGFDYDYWISSSTTPSSEIDDLLNTLIDKNLIKESNDIENDIFKDAIYDALKKDIDSKLNNTIQPQED